MYNKIKNKIKKLNGFAFTVIFLLCLIAANNNPNIENISDSLLLGTISGCIFGLLFAWMEADD